MHKHSFINRLVSAILVAAMMLSMLSGCASKENDIPAISDISIDHEQIADEIIEDLTDDTDMPQAQTLGLSLNVEDYVGDIETFVYGLITYQLESRFDVFPAYVELSEGDEVYGLAYSDFSECYSTEDESQAYFSAGFMPFCGEANITDEEFDNGLIVHNLDYEDESFGFLLKYVSEEFTEHCVVYGQYVKYGVNASGQLFYSSEEYVHGQCDESLGSLYSYDESRYVLDLNVGQYSPIDGVSLASQIDYDLLEEEINKILETQDINYAQIDIETNLYFAQEAVESYLLSLQEETFCGYSVDALIEATQQLAPMECLRLSPEGILTIELDEFPGEGATSLAKWLVGGTCIIVTAVGLVGSVVFMEYPALSGTTGAITGAAIEVFMQVVMSRQALGSVNWSKVIVSTVTGAVSGYLGPYIMAATNGVGYFFADSAIDGMMGAIEHTVAAWLDGEDGLGMIKSFGYGFALGFGLSAGFKGMGELFQKIGIGKMFQKISSEVGAAANKMAPKLTQTISKKFSDVIIAPIGKAVTKLQKVIEPSKFHSKYIANAMAFRQLARLVDGGADDLADKAFANLAKTSLVDEQGNLVTKETLKELFDSAGDEAVIAHIVKGKDVINVVKKNGVVGIEFDPKQYITVDISRITVNRDVNFLAAAEKMKEVWMEEPMTIPASISAAIRESGKTIETIEPTDIVKIVKNRSNGFVFHENVDMKTITLAPRSLHDTIEGGFAHMGGVGVAKYVKAHMGSAYFERLLAAASSGLVSATS